MLCAVWCLENNLRVVINLPRVNLGNFLPVNGLAISLLAAEQKGDALIRKLQSEANHAQTNGQQKIAHNVSSLYRKLMCRGVAQRRRRHRRILAWQGRFVFHFTISTLRPPKLFGKSKSIQSRSVAVPDYSKGPMATCSRFSDDALVCFT